jgi:RNA polymerase sigma-70 factor (ECF subfamily)
MPEKPILSGETPEPDFTSTMHLVRAAQEGDARAREELFARYLPRVRQIVALRLGYKLRQLVEVDDVVQEALLRALEGLAGFAERSEGGFRHWLARCVEHEVVRQARRAGAEKRGGGRVRVFSDLETRLLHATAFAARDPTPSEHARAAELAERIETALLALPAHYRELIVLRQLCEMPYMEIARVLGFTEEVNARMAFSRARQKLRAAIGE